MTPFFKGLVEIKITTSIKLKFVDPKENGGCRRPYEWTFNQ